MLHPTMLDQELASRKLYHYIKQAWHVIEPVTPFVDGWHIGAICEHLQAVTEGQILRLLVNVPPRHCKSSIVTVLWPTWEWGPRKMPHIRWLCASYADNLSTRDNLKSRRIIQSPWYQEQYGDIFKLTSDQNQKTRYENDKTGYRIATSVRGLGTGEGGDRIVVDDPHNTMKAESPSDRLFTLLWWDESMSTRVNHPMTSAKVIIMQRQHDRDLSGHVLEKEADYVHLCLPARYEKDHKCTWARDPRKEIGEGTPLWEGIYSEEALTKLEKEMTSYSIAGQLQQRPTPRGGGIFKVEGFKLVENTVAGSQIIKAVRFWDKAGTDGGGKRTAGVLMAHLKNGNARILDVVKGQWSAAKREARIKLVAELDDVRWQEKNVHVVLEQEPGSGGKESAEGTKKNLMGHSVKTRPAVGDKVSRSEPYQAAVENEFVELQQGAWINEFISEHEDAPNGYFSDQWDAAAGAYNELFTKNKKRAGIW